jgi:3D (Asp-Asp-Asp) domain-containing protein
MTARISRLVIAAALAATVFLVQVSTAAAATAQFFVTGYVLQGYTATGTYVHPGTCAVDPRVVPLGSYLTISGLGTCHAEDTGGAIIGYRIDVWVPTVAQASALTGWYTASWGASPTQQVLGSDASQPESPAPTPTPVPHRRVRAGRAYHQPWYSHGNAYVHRETRAPARQIIVPPTYALISLPAQGCLAVRWTTVVARARACTVATVPTLHNIQEGTGPQDGASWTRVTGPLARAQDHEANVRSAEQMPMQRVVSSPMRERGMLGVANTRSLVEIVRPVATTVASVPLVWLLAITVAMFASALAKRSRRR